MKCISKRKKAAALLGVFVIGLTGCTSKEVVLENAYVSVTHLQNTASRKMGHPSRQNSLQGI